MRLTYFKCVTSSIINKSAPNLPIAKKLYVSIYLFDGMLIVFGEIASNTQQTWR